jgi:hypothetical protein
MPEITQLRVTKNTRERLYRLKKPAQSYDELLNELAELKEKKE